MKKKKTELENTKEKNLSEEKLRSGLALNFVELNILNSYNSEFCRELEQENYKVILAYTNPWCSDYHAFAIYLIDLWKDNAECQQARDKFVDRGLTVASPKKKLFLPRLDIFEEEQYAGTIFLGICVEESQGKTRQFPHSVFLAREDFKEKLEISRAKAHSKIVENPEVKSLIEEEIIKDSLNPKKYPIVGINRESSTNLLKSTHFIF